MRVQAGLATTGPVVNGNARIDPRQARGRFSADGYPRGPAHSMTETPPPFAAHPGANRGGGSDVLAEMLRAVRLTGSVFLNARFSAPFGVVSPKQYDASTPMAHLRHLSVFHLIASGGCTMEIATGERRTVSAGDILLLPFADERM